MKDKLTFVYSKLHFLNIALTLSKDFSSACGGSRAAKIASSNTIFSPVCLRKKSNYYKTSKKKRKNEPVWVRNIRHIWQLSILWRVFRQLHWRVVFAYFLPICQWWPRLLVNQSACRPAGTGFSGNDARSQVPTVKQDWIFEN